jgi:hypothetical protein
MKIEHIAIALGGLAVVGYLLTRTDALSFFKDGGGGGSGGGSGTGDGAGDSTGGGDGTNKGSAPPPGSPSTENADIVWGPGGNQPGAFGLTDLFGSTGGVREEFFSAQVATGNLYSTTGSVYEPEAGDIVKKYESCAGSDCSLALPIGAGGALQLLPKGSKVTVNADKSWVAVDLQGNTVAGGGAGSYGTSSYSQPILVKETAKATIGETKKDTTTGSSGGGSFGSMPWTSSLGTAAAFALTVK